MMSWVLLLIGLLLLGGTSDKYHPTDLDIVCAAAVASVVFICATCLEKK